MTASPQSDSFKHQLLGDVLKRVSRLFYTTLAVLPADVRDQVGLAYLFARAADTIADTEVIPVERRLEFLLRLQQQFASNSPDWKDIAAIQAALLPHQASQGETVLLQRLDDCFRLFENLTPLDKKYIRWLMATLPKGMAMDLKEFAAGTAEHPIALQTAEELDRYTYLVAGCVGEFWTGITCAHRHTLAGWDVEQMAAVGVRFGKGLQLTNIVKDVAHDLRRGRCYIPAPMLAEAGLTAESLLDVNNRDKFQPVLRALIKQAMAHLDQGWLYTMALPRWEVRLRLACMWPILSAGETLRAVQAAPNLLDPTVKVKIPRSTVYRIMALTTGSLGCGYVGSAYWGHIRKHMI
ncbi:MAG: phytoene/squalene synthase family protein [Nitrospiraceae bacterium]